MNRRWFKYDEEKPKRRHAWSRSEAGFESHGGYLVGKCPRGFGHGLAERLLNEGIFETNARYSNKYPKNIYNVYNGVLYRGVPTLRGVSYHGFPVLPKDFEDLDEDLQTAIWERARKQGEEEQLKHWLRRSW